MHVRRVRRLGFRGGVAIGIAITIAIALLGASGCTGAGGSKTGSGTRPPAPAKAAGPYLDQQLPGAFPQSFASSIVRGELHTPPVFTPDGTEAYWALQNDTIVTSRLVDGVWTEPKIASFSPSMTDYRDPCISPDGSQLFFLSKGTIPGAPGPAKENIWLAERSGQGWEEPKPLGQAVNALTIHWQISVAANGDLYFSSGVPDGIGDLYVSRYVGGAYTAAAKLAAPVNTPGVELTPHIAPDQSYLLFSRLNEQTGDAKLFVAFAKGAAWSEPVEVTSVGYCLAPVVSPDGKYLFFLSSPQSVSWMTTEFIQELKPVK